MKKFTKILVLLLSVALVIGAVAMAVSANDAKNSKVFGTDITGELKSANGSYVLSGDSCITSTVALDADLEIDLNGFSLSAACDMFKVNSGINFTIKGEGTIYLFGAKLVGSEAPAETEGLNVAVKGTKGKGISIEHSGAAATIVSATVGNYTFDHVNVNSEASYNNSAAVFFDNAKNSTGANWSFVNVSFNCSTAVGNGAPSVTTTSENVTSVVEVSGSKGTASFIDSKIYNVGNVVLMDNAKTDNKEVMITVTDSELVAVPYYGYRVATFDGGWSGTASGKIVATDSAMSGGYAVLMTAGNTPGANEGYVDNVSLEATDCIIKHTGMTSNSTDNGALTGSPYIYAKGNTVLYTVGTSAARKSRMYVVPGVRMNVNFDVSRTYDMDGNLIAASQLIKVAYDPSNPSAPFVIVEADAELVYPVPAKYGIQNFENNNDKPNDAQAKANAANGTNFIAVSTPEGDEVGATAKNGTTSWMTGNWWNLSGNFGIVKTTESNYMRYYVPGEVGTTVKVQNANKTPNLELSPNFNYSLSELKVGVMTMDIATDTGIYPSANIYIHGRSGSAATANGIALSSTGLLTFPKDINGQQVTVQLPTDATWSSLTAVMYRDVPSSAGGAGTVYWYLNGELVCVVNGIAASGATHVYGIRFDVARDQTAGASFLSDNWANIYYNAYSFEGEGVERANHMPEKYATIVGNYGTYASKPAVLLENKGYYDFAEAVKKAEDSEFDLVLNRDINEVIVVEDRVVVWANGYTIYAAPGSTATSPIYDASGNIIAYAIDPNFNEYKVTYAYFTGDYSDIEQVMNLDYYELVDYRIGQIPSRSLTVSDQYFSHKVGQSIYVTMQVGWGDNYGIEGKYNAEGDLVTLDAAKPITEEYGVKHNGEIIPKFPVFRPSLLSGYNYIVIDKTGYIRLKFQSSDAVWNSQFIDPSKTNALLLDDGDTLLLGGDIKLAGAIEGLVREDTTQERTINVDMNGYTILFDSTPGGSDSSVMFNVRNNETINYYSSVPGALIDMRGVRNKNVGAASGAVFGVCGDASMSTSSNNGLNQEEAIKAAVAAHANVNFGKCVDLDGNVTDGSNITVYSEAAALMYAGDETSSFNVDGVKFVRNGEKGANGFVEADIYRGTVNVSNCEIVSLHSGAMVANNHKAYSAEASDVTVNFYNVKVLTVDATANFLDVDTAGISAVNFENCEIGYSLANANENCTVNVGEGNVFYAIDPANVTIPEGCIIVNANKLISFGEGSYTKVKATETSAGNYNFTTSSVTFAPAGEEATFVLPVLGAKVASEASVKKVTVTFVDFNGETVYEVEVYEGEKITAPDVEIEGIEGDPISYVFGGWSNLPDTATEDVTVTPKKLAVLNLDKTALLQNLTLQTNFSVNLYIPVSEAYTVKSVMVGETALDVTNVVTVDGVKYVKVCAKTNVVNLGNDVEFVITVTAGEYEASETVAINVVEYAEYIIAGDFSTEAKDLMKYILKYAKAANDYFELPNEVVDEAAGNVTVEGFEKNYTALTEEEKGVIASVFSSATVDLSGKAPAYMFTVAEGFTGTVKINGVDYEAVNGVIVVDGIVAYEFLNGVTVVAGETTFTYTFGNYAAEVAAEAPEKAIVDAIYDYCTAAAAYVASK